MLIPFRQLVRNTWSMLWRLGAVPHSGRRSNLSGSTGVETSTTVKVPRLPSFRIPRCRSGAPEVSHRPDVLGRACFLRRVDDQVSRSPELAVKVEGGADQG